MSNNDPSTLVWMSTQTIPSAAEVQQAISDCQMEKLQAAEQIQNDRAILGTAGAAASSAMVSEAITTAPSTDDKLNALIDLLNKKGLLK